MKTGWIGLVFAPLLGGCVFMGGGNRTVFDEEHRLEVRFASQKAAILFWEGMAAADRSDYTDKCGFVILFLAGGGRETFHETSFYNSQVRRTDVDRDAAITEDEARAYGDAVRAKSK